MLHGKPLLSICELIHLIEAPSGRVRAAKVRLILFDARDVKFSGLANLVVHRHSGDTFIEKICCVPLLLNAQLLDLLVNEVQIED